ncbi:MAG: flagellar hook-associated family protein [Aestuariivirga sp.]|uniref:flagellar hook-associated family protein n=1 Tax=Aestuariivirga sp. TaxID=2650926 RepID=UPI0038D214B5
MDFPGNIPSRLLLHASRFSIAQSQTRLEKAHTEASTGRHADIGIALGAQTGSSIRMRIELSAAEFSIASMKQAAAKADITQTSLTALNTLSEKFRSTLTAARNGENGRSVAITAAASSIDAMQDILSASHDGQYLFSGLNVDTAPLKPYQDGPRLAVVAAFEAEFGFPPDDPAAASLAKPQIESFIEESLDAVFNGAGWAAEWSNATDTTQGFRLSPDQNLSLSASANAEFSRKLAQSLSIVDVLGESKISTAAFEAAVDAALAKISETQIAIGREQTRIGFGQATLKDSEPLLIEKKNSLTSSIQALESVDSYEVATRVTLLMTQLESSYALTARIGRMSLLSYL